MSNTSMGRPCQSLSFEDEVLVHAKLADGWLQSRIAAELDVNGGRISEINTGKLHPGSYHEFLKRQRQPK